MKKFISVIAILTLLCFAFTGCGSDPKKTASKKKSNDTETTETVETQDADDSSTQGSSSTTGSNTSKSTNTKSGSKTATTKTTTTKSGSSGSNKGSSAPSSTQTNKTFTVDQYISALNKAGLSAKRNGAFSDNALQSIESIDVKVGGIDICVSRYTLGSSNLKMAIKQHKIKLNLQPGALQPGQSPYEEAYGNGNLVISDVSKSPDKDKLIQILYSLK